MNLYKILNLNKSATTEQVKKAFRKLAAKLHPDHGGDPDAFRDLHTAYRVLSDQALRARYDETGEFDKQKVFSDNEEVLAGLADVFQRMLASGEAFRYDSIISRIAHLVKKHIEVIEATTAELKTTERVLTKLQNKLKRKDSDDEKNVFLKIISDNLEKIKNSIAGNTENCRIISLMLEELDNYEFFDNAVQAFLINVSSGTTASATSTAN